jgi:VanZ family protein
MSNNRIDPISRRIDWVRLLSAWLPVAFGIAVIMTESTKYFGLAETSAPLRHVWESIFGPVASNAEWGTIHMWLRKTGHMLGYGLLGLVFFRAAFLTWRERWTSYAKAWVNCAAFALCGVFAVAAADETHQLFIPGRTGTKVDVLIDMAGAAILQLIVGAYFWWRSNERDLDRDFPLSPDRGPEPSLD